MKDPAKLEIELERCSMEKLQRLAGGEEHISEFLSKTMRRLYRKRCIFSDDLPLDQLISAAEAF